jgi:hypothetical protein
MNKAKSLYIIRQALGLREYEPGVAECLHCGCNFKSWDIKTNRICEWCKEAYDNLFSSFFEEINVPGRFEVSVEVSELIKELS